MPDRAAHVQFLLLVVLGELALSLSETPAEPHAPEEAAPQAEASPAAASAETQAQEVLDCVVVPRQARRLAGSQDRALRRALDRSVPDAKEAGPRSRLYRAREACAKGSSQGEVSHAGVAASGHHADGAPAVV